MSRIAANIVHGIIGFTNKSLVKNLIIITLSILLVLVQVFFPFQYYSSAQRNGDTSFQVGIHYVYEQDELNQIFDQVAYLHNSGFKVMRITMECNPDIPNDYQNQKLDTLYFAADYFGLVVALVIKNLDPVDKIDYYLNRWGSHLTYIQVMNEPEASSTWSAGSIFTDDEIISNFNRIYSAVVAHNLNVKLYTNFGIGYLIRSNVPIELSKKLDFVGFDVFMDSFLVLSPHLVKNLHDLTNKDVIITELGMSTSNDQALSDYLIKGLNLCKSMGLKGCWLVYWNSEFDDYGIRGRLADTAVREWIANNAV